MLQAQHQSCGYVPIDSQVSVWVPVFDAIGVIDSLEGEVHVTVA